MFVSLVAVLSSLVPTLARPVAPALPASVPQAAPEEPPPIAWVEEGFEAAQERARAEDRGLVVLFETSWCTWCRTLEATTLRSGAVRRAARELLWVKVDAEGETGRPLARRFGARTWPTLVFLAPDGSPIDEIEGFLEPRPFLVELTRILAGRETLPALRAAVEAAPNSAAPRLALAAKLRALGDHAGAEREIAGARRAVITRAGYDEDDPESVAATADALAAVGERALAERLEQRLVELDPRGTSPPRRRRAMKAALDTLWSRGDARPVLARLEHERDGEIAVFGWTWVANFAEREANRYDVTKPQLSRERLDLALRALEASFDLQTGDERIATGVRLARLVASRYGDLSAERRERGLEIARETARLAGDEPADALGALAGVLRAAGDEPRARALFERCRALEPWNREWRDALEAAR